MIWEEKAIFDYIRKNGGEAKMWDILNNLTKNGDREDSREQRKMHMLAMGRMIRERKLIQKQTGLKRGGRANSAPAGYWNKIIEINRNYFSSTDIWKPKPQRENPTTTTGLLLA